MVRKPKEVVQISVKLPIFLREFVVDEKKERGVDISTVVIDALNLYRENKLTPAKFQEGINKALDNNPDLLIEPMHKIFRSHPELFDEPLQIIAAGLLQSKKGA